MDANKEHIVETVAECLENIGVIIETNNLETSDVNIIEYNIDSLDFISFIVDVEERLNIIIPEEILRYDILQSFNGFINFIVKVYSEQNLGGSKHL